ncbi:MAG: hypothetical protein OXB91_11740, partial [Bryobacterales bacterium]|nr:hypothetical protein [Bryobacterales bacterium]
MRLAIATATVKAGELTSSLVRTKLIWDQTTKPSFSSACWIFANALNQPGYSGEGAGRIIVVPSGDSSILAARIDFQSSTSPEEILNFPANIVFRFDFNRPFQLPTDSVTGVTLRFQIGSEYRSVQCRPANFFGTVYCFYGIRASDRDLDGFSLSEVTLTIPAGTLDYYDSEVPVTVDPTIPSAARAQRYDILVHGEATSFQLSLSPESLQEGLQEGAGPTEIKITAFRVAGHVPEGQVLIPIVVEDGTADATDYTIDRAATITVPAGSTSGSASLIFTPTDDGIREARVETLRFEAGEANAFVIGKELRILDAPTIRLSAATQSITEDGGAQMVTVRAELGDANDASRPRPIPVRLAFRGSAGPGDYSVAPQPAVVTIPANQRSGTATLTFTPLDDSLLEGDETIELTGSTPGLPVRGSPAIKIEDDETEPEVVLNVSPTMVREDDTEPTQITVSGYLDPNVTLPDRATVVSLTLGGTATLGSGGDYQAAWSTATPTLTIPQGARAAEATLTLTVTPLQDTVVEGDETIVVEGTASTGLVVDVRNSGITVLDDDIPGIVLEPSPLEVAEGGMTTFSVALLQEPAQNVTVRMTT